MTVLAAVNVVETGLWPQGDKRDPLGIFGWRVQATGDGTGGSIVTTVSVPAAQRHAYVYCIYNMTIHQTAGAVQNVGAQIRVLFNWPNIDVQAGIQAYDALYGGTMNGTSDFADPDASFNFDTSPFLDNLRFMPIFDPTVQGGDMPIVIQQVQQTDLIPYAFQGYGYYWDRSVMQAPGGLRHPGSS